jgi:glutaredoxin
MITRPLLSWLGFILLLLPTLAVALNESTDSLTAQSAPALTSPALPATDQAAPAKSAPVPAVPGKPVTPAKPVPAAPVKPAPVPTVPARPVPLPAAPAKPVPLPAVPAKPAPVPAIPASSAPVPARPAPLTAAPVKPAPLPAVPAKPAPVPAISASSAPVPARPAPLPAAPAKPAPVQSAPQQSAPFPIPHEIFTETDSHTVDIEIFVREDCLQCDKAKEFLAKLKNFQPELQIIIRDVRKEPAALELLKRMAQNQGDIELDYPAFVVSGQLIIGFPEDASTAQFILDTLAITKPKNQPAGSGSQNCETGKELSCGLIAPAPVEKPEAATIALFGYSIPVVKIGLPLFTLAMGFLDGFNYGSTWVLILMISLLAPMQNRTAMLSIAGTFIAIQGLIYFILMAAWLNLFVMAGTSRISEIVIASIALLAAAIFLKNYLYFGQRISISSHEIHKPGVYTRIRKIVQAESLAAALLATIVLAIMVQVGEFTYTSIFPAMYTRVLTLQHLGSLSNYGYLFLYNFAYMLDDLILLGMGIATLNKVRSHDYAGRMHKFLSALVMAGLGTYLLLNLQ